MGALPTFCFQQSGCKTMECKKNWDKGKKESYHATLVFAEAFAKPITNGGVIEGSVHTGEPATVLVGCGSRLAKMSSCYFNTTRMLSWLTSNREI
jgi:hypothetical protein